MDAMVNHYTAGKKRRSSDAYTPDAAPGRRPDYAAAVYARKLRKLFPEAPIVIGGVEASLRRLAHYDYSRCLSFRPSRGPCSPESCR